MRYGGWQRWMRGVWKSLAGGGKQRGRAGYRGKAAPQLESLENRLVPAAPSVSSILRSTPAGPVTGASSVTYTVTFDQAVTGVDAADFRVTTANGLVANPTPAVSGGATVYSVTVNGIRGSGTLGLSLVDDD